MARAWGLLAAMMWACDGGDDPEAKDDTDVVDDSETLDSESDPDSVDSDPDSVDSDPDTVDTVDTVDSDHSDTPPDTDPLPVESAIDTFVPGESGPRDTYDTDIPIDIDPFNDTGNEVSLFGTGKARVVPLGYHGWETWHFNRLRDGRDLCVIRYDAVDIASHANPPAGAADITVDCVNCDFQFSVILDNPRELSPAGQCAGLGLPQYSNFPDHWNYGYGYGNGRFYYFYESAQIWAPLLMVAPGDASFNSANGRFRYKSVSY